jgi:antitoxin component YwqK of YwqJK toxin-antitoxin module
MKLPHFLLFLGLILSCKPSENPEPISEDKLCLLMSEERLVGNGKGLIKYEYDKLNNISKLTFLNANGSVNIRNYENTYNSKSQLVKFIVKNESTIFETSTFEYHLNGKISKHTKVAPGSQTIYEYDEKGNQISLVFSDSFSTLSKLFTSYNENGQVIKSESIENGIVKIVIINLYNSKNLLIETTAKHPNSQIINKYEYNDSGQIIKYSNQDGYSTDYIYENGRLVFERNFKNGKFTYVIKSTYYENKLLKNKTISYNSLVYNLLEEFTYHDNQKLKSNIKYQFSLGPNNTLLKMMEYEYDEYGNETRVVRYNDSNGTVNYEFKKTYRCN